jgi:hypothetical protein
METINTMTPLRPTLTTLAALAAAVLAPTLAHAQQPQGAPQAGAPAATTTTAATSANPAAERAIKQMMAKLRNGLAAQEGHYSDHGTYTTSMTALGKYDAALAPSRMSSVRRDSVSVQVIFAGGRGWTGIASHWGFRGRSCVVFVGMAEELPKLPITRADRRTPTEEGVPACDAAPAPPAGPTTQPAAPQATAPAPAPAPAPPPDNSAIS